LKYGTVRDAERLPPLSLLARLRLFADAAMPPPRCAQAIDAGRRPAATAFA